MSLDGEPQPLDFGVDEEAVKYFTSVAHIDSDSMLPVLLGWGSLFASAFLPAKINPLEFVSRHIYGWPILLLFFAPGLLAGFAVNRWREKQFELRKRRHKLYGAWSNYLGADSEWRRVHSKQIEEERARQALLRRQAAVDLRKRLDWWKSLDGRQFEREVANLLGRLGYVAKVTPYSGDGGVDISVLAGATRIIVQCKAHRSYVSAGSVRELYGTLIHQKADEAWLVTTNGFYSGARAFARDKPIKLIVVEELVKREAEGKVSGA